MPADSAVSCAVSLVRGLRNLLPGSDPGGDNGWYELQFPAGAHRVDVTAPGHRPFTVTVDVEAGAATPLNIGLTREKTQ